MENQEVEEVKQEEPKPEIKPVSKTYEPVPLDQDKALAPRDASELVRTISQLHKGGSFPERFDTAEKRLAAYSLGNQLMPGKWQLALNNIAIIKGQMTIYGELPGALAEQTGNVKDKHVFLIDKDYIEINWKNKNLTSEVWGAVCRIQRNGRETKEFYYTLDEATKAGQYPPKKRDGTLNTDSPWVKHTKVMLARKAMALAIKFEFPDALIGVPIAEYNDHSAPDLEEKDVTPKINEEIDNTYLKETNEGAV